MPRAWQNDPQWQMREDHPDPRMRPSVDRLLSKLRNLSQLKDHPDVAEFVLGDLTYRFFVFEQARPQALFRMLMRMENQWRIALGAMWMAAQQGPVYEGEAGIPLADLDQVTHIQQAEVDGVAQVLMNGRLYVAKEVVDEMLKEASESVAKPLFDPNDHESKVALYKLIDKHMWDPTYLCCACGKEFSEGHETEMWASHLRTRIVRFLLRGDEDGRTDQQS